MVQLTLSGDTLLLVYAGCRDIDDALHCTALPNGNYEVGVRILIYCFT